MDQQTDNAASGDYVSAVSGGLQEAANYRFIRKTVRPGGIGSILFGAIAIVVGTTAMTAANPPRPAFPLLTVMGILLIAEGVWLVCAPSPTAFAANDIGWVLTGICYILAAANVSTLGVLVLYGGVWLTTTGAGDLIRYSRLLRLPRSRPSPGVSSRLDSLAKELKEAKAADNPSIVEFRCSALGSACGNTWKGKLDGSRAVFSSGDEIVFATRDNVLIELDRPEENRKGLLRARIRIADRSMRGQFSPESLQRYQRWKKGAGTAPPDNAAF